MLLIDWLYQREFLTSGDINNEKVCNERKERNVNFSLCPINVLADFSEGAGSHNQDNKKGGWWRRTEGSSHRNNRQ